MSQSYVGEIRIFAGNFAPQGWATCDGQLLAISENNTLFNLIGTTYGGDGQNTFALPRLYGRVPIHTGTNNSTHYPFADNGGAETVTLSAPQMPTHNHVAQAALSASTTSAANAVFGGGPAWFEAKNAPGIPMNAGMVSQNGGSQPHDNMVPYLALTYIISLFGIFPSPS